jgi:hypothetical protein
MEHRRPNTRPYCFGNLEIVFPPGQDGLRSSPESCMVCHCKTECLREALAGPAGDKVREEHLDRAADAGMVGFFGRWSRKKQFHRRARGRRQTPDAGPGDKG